MRRLATTLACCTLPFTALACGGDGDGDVASDLRSRIEQEIEAGVDAGPRDGGDTGDTSGGEPRELPAPEFSLTGPVDPPAGWVEDPANCRSSEESGPPLFTYYVPDDWERTGSGYGGSGGQSGTGTHTYELPDGPRIELEIATDGYADGRGTPTGSDGQPWETWDYDITSYSEAGEESHRATYDELDPIEIDGESIDLWYLDQAQSELISRTEYKLRLVHAQVPSGGVDNDLRPDSATVTVSWNAENGDLDEDVVRDVLATIRLDECAQEAIVSQLEMIHGVEW